MQSTTPYSGAEQSGYADKDSRSSPIKMLREHILEQTRRVNDMRVLLERVGDDLGVPAVPSQVGGPNCNPPEREKSVGQVLEQLRLELSHLNEQVQRIA